MNGNKIQVFIFSKQYLYRQGLESSLSLTNDLVVFGDFEFNDQTLSKLDNLPPDVAVIDLDSTENGLERMRKLKQRLPSVGIIALTSNYNDIQLFETLKSQASACLNKEVTAEQLV